MSYERVLEIDADSCAFRYSSKDTPIDPRCPSQPVHPTSQLSYAHWVILTRLFLNKNKKFLFSLLHTHYYHFCCEVYCDTPDSVTISKKSHEALVKVWLAAEDWLGEPLSASAPLSKFPQPPAQSEMSMASSHEASKDPYASNPFANFFDENPPPTDDEIEDLSESDMKRDELLPSAEQEKANVADSPPATLETVTSTSFFCFMFLLLQTSQILSFSFQI